MKKTLPVLFILVALIITASVIIGVKRTKTVDWEESFNEKSNKPYGTSILYKEIPNLFKDKKIRTIYHQPKSYLRANSEDGFGEHIAKGNYIIIGNSDYLEDDSIDELLHFVDTGNTLFISDYYFPQKLHDTLDISVDFVKNKKDSISYLYLKHLDIHDIKLDKNSSDQYFSEYNETNSTVLGHSKIDYKHPNFLEVLFGKGKIFLHLEPKALTNYHILKEDRYKYIEGVLSHLPNADIYFDSYTKIQTSYNSDVEKESNLSWFMEQLSFSWAVWTAIVFGILFMIFNAKRRQRIIKIIKPLQNTTVAFVKTVSNLYFDTKDHKNLIDKKIAYFLEKIRNDLNLNTDVLDETFIETLASKTGNKKVHVKKLVNYINLMKSKNEFFEENLIKLNRYIEAFYSK